MAVSETLPRRLDVLSTLERPPPVPLPLLGLHPEAPSSLRRGKKRRVFTIKYYREFFTFLYNAATVIFFSDYTILRIRQSSDSSFMVTPPSPHGQDKVAALFVSRSVPMTSVSDHLRETEKGRPYQILHETGHRRGLPTNTFSRRVLTRERCYLV